ncbi:MAG: hypothetical protein WDZ40_03070 [Candidatus Spechtbacterales bacterium]
MWTIDRIKRVAGSGFYPAITLPSYASKVGGMKCKIPRLARRGDAILHKAVIDYRAREKDKGVKNIPGNPDFESAKTLFKVAIILGLHEVVRMSPEHREEFLELASQEEPTKHIMRNLSEPLEALIGVIEYSAGYDTAIDFIHDNVIETVIRDIQVDTSSALLNSLQNELILIL